MNKYFLENTHLNKVRADLIEYWLNCLIPDNEIEMLATPPFTSKLGYEV